MRRRSAILLRRGVRFQHWALRMVEVAQIARRGRPEACLQNAFCHDVYFLGVGFLEVRRFGAEASAMARAA